MAAYLRTKDERDCFDAIIAGSIKDGFSRAVPLIEEVQARLVKTKQPWAKHLARDSHFRRALRTALARLLKAKMVHRDGIGTGATWHVT